MREEIRALQQRLQLTVAYVTHDQSEALAVSDQIIVMDAGLIAQAGTPRQLYEQPATEFVAGFMGEAMRFEAVVDEAGQVHLGALRFAPRLRVAPGPVRVAVRPEAWQVAALSADSASDAPAGALPGTLRKMAYLGSFLELTVDTPLGEVFVVSPEVDQPWQLGDALLLRLGSHGVSVAAG
jgi:iron(III) transport system ATP-binding protein